MESDKALLIPEADCFAAVLSRLAAVAAARNRSPRSDLRTAGQVSILQLCALNEHFCLAARQVSQRMTATFEVPRRPHAAWQTLSLEAQ